MDKHDLISRLKDLYQELGQTPTRAQFEKHIRGGKYALEREYGTYTELVIAAGLAPHRAQRITNQIFETSIERHLQRFEPSPVIDRKPYPTMAIISDIHWPFENERVVKRFQEYVGDIKPEYVIINGDAIDLYSHSRYPRSHNVFTPREEQAIARTKNEDFWKAIQSASPNSKCTQTLGNHDIRPLKRVLESYPEAEDWIAEKMKALFSFPNVETIHDPREEVIIGDIAIFHGYRTKLGDHRDYTLYNAIVGHTHRGGVVFRRVRGQTLWELNSGLAGDPEAKGLTYTMQKLTEWTPGFGVVNKLGPQFVAL